MKKSLIVTMFLLTQYTHANFITDSLLQYRSNRAFQAKDFKHAQQDYTTLLEKAPYDPATNYNLGLTFFQQKQLEQALDCFTRTTKHTTNSLLQEQAFFNQGNTFAELNKLQEAIKAYEKVLSINPNNDRAQHNLEIIKKRLQQQQEKGNEQNKQNDQKNQKGDNKNNDKNQQPGEPQSQEQQSDDQNPDKLNDQKDQKEGKQQHEQQKESNKNRDQQENKPEQNQTKEESAEQLEKSKQQKEKQDNPLQKSTNKQEQSSDADKKDQESQEEDGQLQDELAQHIQPDAKDDERLHKNSAVLMQKMNDQEDHIQKQLLKMNVSKQGATKHGQKNW